MSRLVNAGAPVGLRRARIVVLEQSRAQVVDAEGVTGMASDATALANQVHDLGAVERTAIAAISVRSASFSSPAQNFKMLSVPARSGRSISTATSGRPGRSRAGSTTSGLLVAPITMTPRRVPDRPVVEPHQQIVADGHPIVSVPAVEREPVGNAVDLVEEQDAGRHCLGAVEDLAHRLEYLVEVAVGLEPVRNAGGHGRQIARVGEDPCIEGFAEPRLAMEQNSFLKLLPADLFCNVPGKLKAPGASGAVLDVVRQYIGTLPLRSPRSVDVAAASRSTMRCGPEPGRNAATISSRSRPVATLSSIVSGARLRSE